jgi:hypothetical protein
MGGDGTSRKRTSIVFAGATIGIEYIGPDGGALNASGWPFGCAAIGCGT